jgi:hypothetical protein
MSGSKDIKTPALKWHELPESTRVALAGRLEGLYGGKGDESIFDSLAVDKQQALLILIRRLLAVKLWDTVQRIENLYGEGGVGMNFTASPSIKSMLEQRKDFTTRFAKHHNTIGGFMERRTGRASLHILYTDKEAQHWEAHFDLYNPWTSPLNAWRHLVHEKIRKETPNWRVIGSALGYFDKKQAASVSK